MLEHCLAKPGAWADNPWDHEHPVITVGEAERGRIFAFLGTVKVGVKSASSREAADESLARYPGDATVMACTGRSGWNDLALDGAISDNRPRATWVEVMPRSKPATTASWLPRTAARTPAPRSAAAVPSPITSPSPWMTRWVQPKVVEVAPDRGGG